MSGATREAENAIRFLRDQIDAIDLQLIALLVQRARLAVRIGEVKEYAELPVIEMNRENQVLSRVEKLRSEPLDALGAKEIFSAIMVAMRRLQSRGREDMPPAISTAAARLKPSVKKKRVSKK